MKRILIFISLFLSVTVFGQGVAIRSNGGIGTNLTIYTKLTIPNTDGAWFQPFPSHGIGWWDPGAGNYAFWTVDDGLFANTFSIPSLAQATKSVALIGIPPNGTVEGSTLPNDATKFLNGQGGFAALYASNVVSGGQIPVAAISGLSPTFNSITGTNMSLYGPNGGAIKLYDASGNGPYAQLGTNDNFALSNSATAMTVTLTNGGANFGSNVVAKHFYGDGSTLTGVGGGGSGTVSNAAALTLNQFVIGGGGGAVSTTLDGSSLTNVSGFAILKGFQSVTTALFSGTSVRATNFNGAYINNASKFAVAQTNGYITNLIAGDFELGFMSASDGGDVMATLFTNNVSTTQTAFGLTSTTRGMVGHFFVEGISANTALSIGLAGSTTEHATNYSFWAREIK